MNRFLSLILLSAILVMLASQVNATIWYVHPDSSLNTVQAGLDSSSAGDTVMVASGTYYETIVWPSTPGIELISEFGPDVTVIDANGSGRVITMAQYLTPVTLIDGFTILKGWATGTSPDDYGGAIYCLNTSPTIRNNIIRNNSAYSRGGGIYCENSNPQIIGNTIQDNGITSGSGGAIDCQDTSDVLIQENYFDNNSAPHGGAICASRKSYPTIQYNKMLNNTATYGGAIHNSSTTPYGYPEIHYNDISGNQAWGLYNDAPGWISAQNNWWGHSAGPDSGDAVDGPATVEPWLIEEIVFDIAVISIEAPPDTVTSNVIYTPKIIVRNNCNYNYPVSFFTARCTINGHQDYVRIDRPIPQDSTIEVTFEDWVPVGTHPVEYIMSVELFYAVDQDSTNDTISKEIYYTDVEDTEVPFSPSSFTLSQNYPNPFNPTTVIHYQLRKASLVELAIWNTLGQKIRTLVYEDRIAGNHSVIWDGRDDQGVLVGSGVYFYQLKAGAYKQTCKMLLVR